MTNTWKGSADVNDYNIKQNDWEQCPRCESVETQTIGKLGMFLILIGTGSCSLFVGLLFPPIWLLSIVLILGSPVAVFAVKMSMCKKCKYTWRTGQSDIYKQAIEDKKEAKR